MPSSGVGVEGSMMNLTDLSWLTNLPYCRYPDVRYWTPIDTRRIGLKMRDFSNFLTSHSIFRNLSCPVLPSCLWVKRFNLMDTSNRLMTALIGDILVPFFFFLFSIYFFHTETIYQSNLTMTIIQLPSIMNLLEVV